MTSMGIFMRGLAMGAADAVPGVSGGTIAFLTGIYPRWLAVLTALHPRLLMLGVRGHWGTLWRALDGAFVLPLAAGMIVALVSVAHVITYGLRAWPERIWGLFFGLVIIMGLGLMRQIWSAFQIRHVAYFAIGLVSSVSIGLLQPVSLQMVWWGWPLAGALALSAMLLPGISGSFLLVLIGVYPLLMTAVTTADWVTLGLFALGGGCGLIAMAHLLRWLLVRAEMILLSLLTGVVFGALVRIWPWQSSDQGGMLVLAWPSSLDWVSPTLWILVGLLAGLVMLRLGQRGTNA